MNKGQQISFVICKLINKTVIKPSLMYHESQSHQIIFKPFLQSSASQKNYYLPSNQPYVSGRLKQNIRMIEMINSSMLQESRQRNKDFRLSVQSEGSEREKKQLMGQLMSKLDFAINDTWSSKDGSRVLYHQGQHMEDKIKQFQNRLKEAKEGNTNSQLKLNRIKDQARHSSLITLHRPEIQYKSYKCQRPQIRSPSTILAASSRIKGNYEFQKYIKPERRKKYRNGCIQPDCRGVCRCYERQK